MKNISLPNPTSLSALPLNALRCFHFAGRMQSFTRAAQALNLTQSAVSQQIRQLESRLGYPLFLRANRQLMLTDPGRMLLDAVGQAFDHIESTLSRLAVTSRPVMVACCPSFALQWLVPRLAGLRQQAPLIDVKIKAAFTLPDPPILGDLSDEGYADVVISYQSPGQPAPDSVALMPEYLALAASPLYLQRHPAFARGDSLDGVTILHDNAVWHDAPRHAEWQAWARVRRPDWLCPQSNQYFNMSSMAMGAASAHQGAAIVRRSLASEELASGVLALQDAEWVVSPAQYRVTVRRGADDPVRTFVKWLTRECDAYAAQPAVRAAEPVTAPV